VPQRIQKYQTETELDASTVGNETLHMGKNYFLSPFCFSWKKIRKICV